VITVVLPAYQEAAALPRLLERLGSVSRDQLGGRLEAVVVDDGSTDGTSGVAVSGAPGLRVRLVVHDSNLGLGAAIDTGLRTALAGAGADHVVVTMDADDTHPPGAIPQMAERIAAGADVVIASRFQPGAVTLGVPRIRRLLSAGMSALFRTAYPIPGARDYSSGYRAYRAAILHRAYQRWGDEFVSETGFSCMVDILMKLAMLGARVTEVPLELRYDRKASPSKMPARDTVGRTLVLLARGRLGRLD
jgi:dolichol-phosphate mannosyltransferase